jgi:hypothetical protein
MPNEIRLNGGEGGIRTPEGLAPFSHFECSSVLFAVQFNACVYWCFTLSAQLNKRRVLPCVLFFDRIVEMTDLKEGIRLLCDVHGAVTEPLRDALH